MRRPDFIIAGTQKAGTTWLRSNLFAHPRITGPQRQLHFFDRHYDNGLEWYCSHFRNPDERILLGEKTTEYFDTATADVVAARIARDCPDTKIVVVLRDPVERALSALRHTVNSGLEPLPDHPDALLFEDRQRPKGRGFGYVERGFYARQIRAFRRCFPAEQILVLVFEEDIVAAPAEGLARTVRFLGVPERDLQVNAAPVNQLRLSRPAIRMMHAFSRVPYVRSAIWRADRLLGLEPWRPRFSPETHARLREIFRPENERLFEILGRRIPAWGGS